MKKKLITIFAILLFPLTVAAGGGGVALDPVNINLNDKESLQKGARTFVNYCLSCHSAGYMRYNRMGQDLGISEELVAENLLFAAEKTGDLMKAVMPAADAKKWFGTAPPDLTLTARSRGPKWIYTYMRSFYRDESAPSGWNNKVFAHVAMPHVLYEWQGEQRPIIEKDSHGVEHITGFEIAKAGTMTEKEYNEAMRDLTNFMVYLAEPAKLVRYKIGLYVILFLIIFMVAAYMLKKEYWKDVH
ncbi:MAG: cytochrome c1 [Gammaproteobacteria bacterium]|nr:cytochrome c1 [Gammaproteobacteria bacterium]